MRLSKRVTVVGSVLLTLLAAAIATWVVFRPGGAGPLRTLTSGGQPLVNEAGGRARPGRNITATAYVFNSSHDPVTLLSATAVPVPGQRAGHLAHVAVDTSKDVIGSGRGWPPGVPVRPLPGSRQGYGQTGIVFGITGSGPGFWVVAGLRLTYRWHGRVYSVIAWSVNDACIGIRDCDRRGRLAQLRTQKLAGSG
jgi:hypothetical protein